MPKSIFIALVTFLISIASLADDSFTSAYENLVDDAGNIIEAFIPSFNTLNIFLVPRMHSVQLVSPFAGGNRTSYLGWLHR